MSTLVFVHYAGLLIVGCRSLVPTGVVVSGRASTPSVLSVQLNANL